MSRRGKYESGMAVEYLDGDVWVDAIVDAAFRKRGVGRNTIPGSLRLRLADGRVRNAYWSSPGVRRKS